MWIGDVIIESNGSLWVAKFNGTRYADCDKSRLSDRLYKDGAKVVYERVATKDESWIGKILSSIKNGAVRKCIM